MADYGKDLKPLRLLRVSELLEEGGVAPQSEPYALVYREKVYRVPAGARVDLDITGKLRIVTEVHETRH
jgi:hypothetical protein